VIAQWPLYVPKLFGKLPLSNRVFDRMKPLSVEDVVRAHQSAFLPKPGIQQDGARRQM